MKAVIIEKRSGPPFVTNDRPPPRLRPTYMLVRTKAVAINPADVVFSWMGMGNEGTLMGCDYSGIVEEVGPGVQRRFKKGDRVCGGTRPCDPLEPENGTFAELICVKADIALHIPPGMSFEEASTLGVTHITTGRCLYQKFGLPLPDKAEPNPGLILIYGGSSAMGTMLIQFAKLSKFEVITTCSPRNFDLCKSYGADHVMDYNNFESIEQIKTLTKGVLRLCVDCISTEETAEFCAKVISPGAKYSNILLGKCPRDDVECFNTIGFSFLGEDWEQFGKINPASVEDFEFSKRFAELGDQFLNVGKIKSHPLDLRRGGLDAVPTAVEDLKAKNFSGAKIVVSL